MKIRRALISVFDKSKLPKLLKALSNENVQIISTGGSFKHIQSLGFSATQVSSITAFPEILDGRVKTLHPAIHAGILSRRTQEDQETIKECSIEEIDLVVVNLYPFEQVVEKNDCTLQDAIENIDIGGPSMIRAAAKNHQHVCTLCDPNDYSEFITQFKQADTLKDFSKKMAVKAFFHTAWYDTQIQNYLSHAYQQNEVWSEHKILALHQKTSLRYGENPHQKARVYQTKDNKKIPSIFSEKPLQGKELSFNNFQDIDAAWGLVCRLASCACVIVKHANPCGVSISGNALSAYQLAFEADPISAFGGIIAFNAPVNQETAECILNQQFVEVVVAPSFEEKALQCFSQKPNLRVLKLQQSVALSKYLQYKSMEGGWLVQEADQALTSTNTWMVAGKQQPKVSQNPLFELAWQVVRCIKSNAIVIVNHKMQTIGIGAGQTNRVQSVELAIKHAQKLGFDLSQSVAASDAFFPFPDSIELLAKVGVSAVVQTGGSIKDAAVINAANAHNMVMILTHQRHFKH